MGAFRNISDIFKMVRNMGPMKQQMEEIQAKVARLRITGEAGAGMVKVTVSGDGRVEDCKIDAHLLDPSEFGMLEDLFIAATNDALTKSKEAVAHEMQALMKAQGMPDMDEVMRQMGGDPNQAP